MMKRLQVLIMVVPALALLWECSLFAPDDEVSSDVSVVYDILNASNDRYDYDIWITDFNGDADRILLPGTTNDYDPVFNTDGSGFFYISGVSNSRDLYFSDTTGSEINQITEGHWVNSYDISPAGDKLVFVDDTQDNPTVYTINVDGSNIAPLCRGWEPLFTDNGDAVILLSSEGSRNLRKVTMGSSDTLEITSSAPGSNLECVSRDRNRFIVYTRPNNATSYMYYLMDGDGTFLHTLNFASGPFGSLSLSSDGKEIGYSAYSTNSAGIELYMGNSGVTSTRQLTRHGLIAKNSIFFPGDNFLVYTLENGSDYSLYHVDNTGQEETRLTHVMGHPPNNYDVYAY